MINVVGDVFRNENSTNEKYQSNGGNGIFEENDVGPGVDLVATESWFRSEVLQFTYTIYLDVTEKFRPLALNSFCDVIR